MHDLSWNFYGQYYAPLRSVHESSYGYRNNFFRFKDENKKVSWIFLRDEYDQCHIEPYVFK
jgi:hypothetical protein